MTTFLGLVAAISLSGLGVLVYLFVNQKAMTDILLASSTKSAQELAQCRASYTELKGKAETHIRGLMHKLAEEQAKTASLRERATVLAEKIKRWQAIIDAEAEAQRVIKVAAAKAEQIIDQAGKMYADAESKAKGAGHHAEQIMAQAKRDADNLKANAATFVEQANLRAAEILVDADRNARAIAGEAYEVKQNVSKYERMLRAIRNEIGGYGDEYIVPAQSLLDDLAEEVGYSEAGQRLKVLRERVKNMVKISEAADCDYAEAARRETAIRFVTDAFNGKVDSILSRVKAENGGKLQQQIMDAFAIVNGNGEAFRNARITQEFLNARLEELKWACIAHEIKKQEAEEQRRIKERIREEEKAKKEFERAIKAAAKDEDTMKKAEAKVREQMEKNANEERERFARASAEEREQLEKAAAEQRAQFEAELAAIQAKMQEIEEKGRRALSMAQQTKKGNVYISPISALSENTSIRSV